MKSVISQMVTAAGWTALLEERVGGRIADVLAVPPDSHPGEVGCIAFEVQLSRQHAEVTQQRSDDYAACGIATLWVVKNSMAIGGADLPHLAVDSDCATAMEPISHLHRSVVDLDGVTVQKPYWLPRTAPLDHVVTAVLRGRVTWCGSSPGRGAWRAQHLITEHAQLQVIYDKAAAVADKKARARRETHLANLKAHMALKQTTADALEQAAIAAGHTIIRRAPDKSGWYAHAVLIRTADSTFYAVHPVASQVGRGARRKLTKVEAVVVSTHEDCMRLAREGIAAVRLEDLTIRPPRSVAATPSSMLTSEERDALARDAILEPVHRTAEQSHPGRTRRRPATPPRPTPSPDSARNAAEAVHAGLPRDRRLSNAPLDRARPALGRIVTCGGTTAIIVTTMPDDLDPTVLPDHILFVPGSGAAPASAARTVEDAISRASNQST